MQMNFLKKKINTNMKLLKIILIITYVVINTFLISHNLCCLPLELISKILDSMKDNPSKSGVILQLLYFCIVAYFEVPNYFPEDQETKIELPTKIQEKENENEI